MGKSAFHASDILLWGSVLVLITVLAGLALMKLTEVWKNQPLEMSKTLRWGLLVGVLAVGWLLTFSRCFLWWRNG